MTNWEYKIVSLTSVESVALLNDEGRQGWEAVGIAATSAAASNVLLKRPLAAARASGGRM